MKLAVRRLTLSRFSFYVWTAFLFSFLLSPPARSQETMETELECRVLGLLQTMIQKRGGIEKFPEIYPSMGLLPQTEMYRKPPPVSQMVFPKPNSETENLLQKMGEERNCDQYAEVLQPSLLSELGTSLKAFQDSYNQATAKPEDLGCSRDEGEDACPAILTARQRLVEILQTSRIRVCEGLWLASFWKSLETENIVFFKEAYESSQGICLFENQIPDANAIHLASAYVRVILEILPVEEGAKTPFR